MRFTTSSLVVYIGILAIMAIFTGCGKKGTVTFKSGKSIATGSSSNYEIGTFKGCVGSIEAYDEDGNVIAKDGITLSSQDLPAHFDFVGSEGKLMASGEMPVGDKVSKIVLKMTSSSSNCPGTDGNAAAPKLQFNSYTVASNENSTLAFHFSPAVEIKSGDSISLNAQGIANTLSQTSQLSSLNLSEAASAASGVASK